MPLRKAYMRNLREQRLKKRQLHDRTIRSRQQNRNYRSSCDKPNEDQEYEYRLVPDEIYPNRTFKWIKVRKGKPTIIVLYER